MPETTSPSAELSAYMAQVDGFSAFLQHCLSAARITGAQAKRCLTRLSELKDEVTEVFDLIAHAAVSSDLSSLRTYEQFAPKATFSAALAKRFSAALAKRATDDIQDLGSNIQDSIAQVAESRRSELKKQLPAEDTTTNPKVDADTLEIWRALSYTDCIDEIASVAEALVLQARTMFYAKFAQRLALCQQESAPNGSSQ